MLHEFLCCKAKFSTWQNKHSVRDWRDFNLASSEKLPYHQILILAKISTCMITSNNQIYRKYPLHSTVPFYKDTNSIVFTPHNNTQHNEQPAKSVNFLP